MKELLEKIKAQLKDIPFLAKGAAFVAFLILLVLFAQSMGLID